MMNVYIYIYIFTYIYIYWAKGPEEVAIQVTFGAPFIMGKQG